MKQTLIKKWEDKIAQYDGLIAYHKEDKRRPNVNDEIITDCNAEIRRLNFLKHQAQEFIADLESI